MIKFNKQKIVALTGSFLIMMLSSNFSYAEFQLRQAIKSGHPVLSIGAGGAFTSDLGNSKEFAFMAPTPNLAFRYSSSHTTQVEAIGDIFFGGEWSFAPNWALQFGLGYAQTAPFTVNETFSQAIRPLINTPLYFDNKYDIRGRQILVENKFEYIWMNRYRPYFMFGLGAGINTANNFVAYVPFPNLTREYRDNTITSFSYNLGIGIDTDLTDSFRIGLGYRFSDFGKAQLGHANIFKRNINGVLSQSHMYVNEILAQVTFVFC